MRLGLKPPLHQEHFRVESYNINTDKSQNIYWQTELHTSRKSRISSALLKREEEERADWQESNFLISDVSVKPFLLQKQLYLRPQRFCHTTVVWLGRKHKTVLENKAVSKFSPLLPDLGEEAEEMPYRRERDVEDALSLCLTTNSSLYAIFPTCRSLGGEKLIRELGKETCSDPGAMVAGGGSRKPGRGGGSAPSRGILPSTGITCRLLTNWFCLL